MLAACFRIREAPAPDAETDRRNDWRSRRNASGFSSESSLKIGWLEIAPVAETARRAHERLKLWRGNDFTAV